MLRLPDERYSAEVGKRGSAGGGDRARYDITSTKIFPFYISDSVDFGVRLRHRPV